MEKTKTIYPLYTSYTGGINSSSCSPDILLTRFHMFTMHKSRKGHNSTTTSPIEKEKNLVSLFFMLVLYIEFQDLDRVKRIWYLSPMRAANVQASLRIRAVSPEPSLLAHTSSESRGTFRQKARSLAPLNGWACAVGICHY